MINAEDAASTDYEADGTLLTVDVGWDKQFGNVSTVIKGGYYFNDAKGMLNQMIDERWIESRASMLPSVRLATRPEKSGKRSSDKKTEPPARPE